MLPLCTLSEGCTQIRYVGVDAFESAGPEVPHMNLKAAHRMLAEFGVKAHLIPGDPTGKRVGTRCPHCPPKRFDYYRRSLGSRHASRTCHSGLVAKTLPFEVNDFRIVCPRWNATKSHLACNCHGTISNYPRSVKQQPQCSAALCAVTHRLTRSEALFQDPSLPKYSSLYFTAKLAGGALAPFFNKARHSSRTAANAVRGIRSFAPKTCDNVLSATT